MAANGEDRRVGFGAALGLVGTLFVPVLAHAAGALPARRTTTTLDGGLAEAGASAVDLTGDLFIADNAGIRKAVCERDHHDGRRTASPGFSGDGGPVLAAQFYPPLAILPRPTGDLLVADYGNQRLRRPSE